MDDRRFDDLTKLVGRRASRRSVIKAAIAGAVASVFGSSVAEAALAPVKSRPNTCIQPGQPCAAPRSDPSRKCCYKCNNSTHKCCENIGYLCTRDADCCKTTSGVQPICRDPQAAGSDRRKACFLPGTLTPGAQCIQGSDCASGNCVNGVCSACAVGTTSCGANCCNAAQCQTCVNGVCKSKCGPCQTCNGSGQCINTCTKCQSCVNGVCRAKTCPPCHTCNPDSGLCAPNCTKCQTCRNGQCVARCNLCQTCDEATGVCTPKSCPNLCDACNPATGLCAPKTCGPCQQCDPATGVCESTCDNCHFCQNNVCLPNCPDPCLPCDPYSGICGEIVCDAPCAVCQGGECAVCAADQCLQCNQASDTCESTCGPCTTCDASGTCVALCGDCEICANGQCRPLCGPCMECNVDDDVVTCQPVVCAGDCQTCNPDSGQCEACGENTCTHCDALTGQCVSDCGECSTCINGECPSCTNLPCSQCGAAPGQCISLCSDACFTCDVNTNECVVPTCDDPCAPCFAIPGGVATCLDIEPAAGVCVHCDDGVLSPCGNCEFCGPAGCTSCIGLPCWTCVDGACSYACDTCQFCTDAGVCVDYTCGPDQLCDQFGGCDDTCTTTSDCGACRTCIDGRCFDCPYCVDGSCAPTGLFLAELAQVSPNPQIYMRGGEFEPMRYSGNGNVTATVQGVDLTLPPTPVTSSTSGCDAADFAGFVPGRIALIQRGTCTFRIKVLNAQAAGAVGVIIFNEGQPGRTAVFPGSLEGPGISIPVVSASFAVGEDLSSPAGTIVHLVVTAVV